MNGRQLSGLLRSGIYDDVWWLSDSPHFCRHGVSDGSKLVKNYRHISVAIFNILCRYDAYVDLCQARPIGFLSPFYGSQIGNLLTKRREVGKRRPFLLKLRNGFFGLVE